MAAIPLPVEAIPLPVDKELKTVSSSLDIQNMSDHVSRTTVNHTGGGGDSDTGFRCDTWNIGHTLREDGNLRCAAVGFTIGSTSSRKGPELFDGWLAYETGEMNRGGWPVPDTLAVSKVELNREHCHVLFLHLQ